MVLGEAGGLAAAGAAGVGVEIFNYNRENFKYDRELRQKNEISLLNFRIQHASLWREDVRDIIGMTERKMDSYLVVAILELGMCVGFFSKGRLEPSVPPWLLTLYLLSLAGTLVYLLMAVLFAMHAAVVANCTSVRLTTQFVRLPIPTWEQIEEIRTYASAFETLPWSKMLRVPFLGSRSPLKQVSEDVEDGRAIAPRTCDKPSTTPDPWALERPGHERNLEELLPMNPGLRMHVELARRASLQYQCFDAFARVSMSFGTTQLMHAIMYYILGTIAWQNGAVWPSICIGLIMTGIQSACIVGDLLLSRCQQLQANLLLLGGELLAAFLVADSVLARGGRASLLELDYCYPVVCVAQAAWLSWAMGLLQIRKVDSGVVLPTNFRAVLYLDVFGWLKSSRPSELDTQRLASLGPVETTGETAVNQRTSSWLSRNCPTVQGYHRLEAAEPTLHQGQALLSGKISDGLAHSDSCSASTLVPETNSRSLEESGTLEFHFEAPELEEPRLEHTETNLTRYFCSSTPATLAYGQQESMVLEDDPVGDRRWELHDSLGGSGSSFSPPQPSSANGPRVTPTLRKAPHDVFDPCSFSPGHDDSEMVATAAAEVARLHPGRWPARTFHAATLLLVFFWASGLLFPISCFRGLMMKPRVEEMIMEVEETYEHQKRKGRRRLGYVGTDPSGNPMFIHLKSAQAHPLKGGERLNVAFPENAGFFPRALSSDRTGQQLLVASDVGLHMAVGVATPIDNNFRSKAKRQLRAENKSVTSESEALPFHAVHPCSGLEGQSVRDASVVCEKNGGQQSNCRIFVLVSNSPQILECPSMQEREQADVPNREIKDTDASFNVAWAISKDWLYQKHAEQVDSLAIDNACLRRHERGADGHRHFSDMQATGCIIIGTGATSHKHGYGRIVQLKEKYSDQWTLVPERSLHVRNTRVNPGALHVLDSGFVLALSTHHGQKDNIKTETFMESFCKETGKMKLAWKLPDEVNWLALSGSGTHLMLIGLRQTPWQFELWRFPLPEELIGDASSPMLQKTS
mmetsp:Transcript_95303/g.188916  ORF Transcript_95303/g.188916 Transcript_95303/m.188916 type:complete len:1031 (-) Transcript_95303:277-3369(-)